jgi:chromosome segregation ATPase
MKRMAKLRTVLYFMTPLCVHVSANAQQGCQPEWEQYISAQIVDLRAYIDQLLAESHDRRIEDLTREIEHLRSQQQTLDKEERQLRQQISDVETQLSVPNLDENARVEIETIRAQLTGEATDKLRSDRAVLEGRITDSASRLAQEKQRYERVKGSARLFKP